jgi:hypothetical protein
MKTTIRLDSKDIVNRISASDKRYDGVFRIYTVFATFEDVFEGTSTEQDWSELTRVFKVIQTNLSREYFSKLKVVFQMTDVDVSYETVSDVTVTVTLDTDKILKRIAQCAKRRSPDCVEYCPDLQLVGYVLSSLDDSVKDPNWSELVKVFKSMNYELDNIADMYS